MYYEPPENTELTDSDTQQMRGFHLMAKPSGPACNLNCAYCFYTEKSVLYPEDENPRMPDDVLEAYISKYIAAQEVPEIVFSWQGGEPTMMGIDFFKQVLELQERYSDGRGITNSIQTNGVLLTEEWCRFLAKNNFLIGLSLDGPREIHDRYRLNRGGKPTFDSVVRALHRMQKHGVEFNVLASVTRESAKQPLEVYHFLKKEGVEFVQFIPIVERAPDARADELGLKLAVPPASEPTETAVTPWTVEPADWGSFLSSIFEEWVHNDVGRVFVMNFEWAMAGWAGVRNTVCTYSRTCGDCLVIEHNGDIYACDHYVYPEHKRGNILTDDLASMVWSDEQSTFGESKETKLTAQCRECPVLQVCRGDCLKHRFAKSAAGEPGHSYLCPGYLKFLKHSKPYINRMLEFLSRGMPAECIMQTADDPLAAYFRR